MQSSLLTYCIPRHDVEEPPVAGAAGDQARLDAVAPQGLVELLEDAAVQRCHRDPTRHLQKSQEWCRPQPPYSKVCEHSEKPVYTTCIAMLPARIMVCCRSPCVHSARPAA